MPRSPESRARRAAYARAWRRRHPDYHRRYAEEHRERVRAQTRARQCRYRERNPGLWRRYRDRDRALPAVPPLHWEEELRWARLLVDRVCLRDLTVPYAALDDDYHDLVAEALLAHVEGRDPEAAVRAARAAQRRWERARAPLPARLSA